LIKLIPGYDYFNKISIPYLGNENNNPNFHSDINAINKASLAYREALNEAFETDPEFQKIISDAREEIAAKRTKKSIRQIIIIFIILYIVISIIKS
jgi:hypothetical protein